MDTEPTVTLDRLSTRYVLLGLWFGLLAVPAICLCCFVIGIFCWMWMASRRIASAIRSSWTTSRFGMSFSSKHLSKPFAL